MTIEEMKQQKQQLCFEIARLVREFQDKVGVIVDHVHVKRGPMEPNSTRRPDFQGIEVDIHLDV
jgi:hypothetical protein